MAVFITSNPFEHMTRHFGPRMHPYHCIPRAHSCLSFPFAVEPERPKFWFCKKEIRGFKPSNVNVKVEDGRVIIHARVEDGEDYFELKKHVKLPSNVNKDSVKCVFRNGFVHMIGEYEYKKTAPCEKNESHPASPKTPDADDTRHREGEISGEEAKTDDVEHMNADEEPKKSDGEREELENDKCECDREVSKINSEKAVQNEEKDFGIFMPGFNPEDIKVKVNEDNVLTVEASSRTETDGSFRSKEMVRSVKLPESVNFDNLKTIYRDGFLEIKFSNSELESADKEMDCNESS